MKHQRCATEINKILLVDFFFSHVLYGLYSVTHVSNVSNFNKHLGHYRWKDKMHHKSSLFLGVMKCPWDMNGRFC